MNRQNDKRMREFLEWAARAIAAGVVLRLKDWEDFSPEEQDWWLAARVALATPQPPAAVEPQEDDDEDEEPEVDHELRGVLEAGASVLESRTAR